MGFLARPRRWAGWLCIASILWMGLAAQRHMLLHAIEAAQTSGKADASVEPSLSCAQCLQYAATDAISVAAPPAFVHVGLGALEPAARPPGRLAETFVAYASRAPPTV